MTNASFSSCSTGQFKTEFYEMECFYCELKDNRKTPQKEFHIALNNNTKE